MANSFLHQRSWELTSGGYFMTQSVVLNSNFYISLFLQDIEKVVCLSPSTIFELKKVQESVN